MQGAEPGMTLQELLIKAVGDHSDREAVVAGATRLKYKDLGQSVAAVQKGLRELGIQKGETAGILLPNSIEFIVAYFALTCMGNTAIPLNPMLTRDELAYILRDSAVKTLIGHTQLIPLMEQLQNEVSELKNILVTPEISESKKKCSGWHSFSELLTDNGKSFALLEEKISPNDVAAILYTSGTTGKPKGAMLTHQNLFTNAQSCYETLMCTAEDSFLVGLPLFHAFQATVGMLTPTIGGCKMVILNELKPGTLFEMISKEKLTFFLGVPSMYLLMTRAPKEEKPSSFFRLCVSGGAALPVSVAEEFQKRFSLPIHEGYGLTEASPVCAVNPIDKAPRTGSIGVPIKGVEMKVVDENGEEVPRGEVGELVVRGKNVMKGYHGLPEETRKTIRGKWLHTGDMAKQDEEGLFYIVDRKKEMIIVAGENVYPREVEEVLYSHPNIAEAAVIGIPDKLRGEVPKAFVRLKEGASATPKEILLYLKERLAPFKLPKNIALIEAFPKNATGKILKKELRAQS